MKKKQSLWNIYWEIKKEELKDLPKVPIFCFKISLVLLLLASFFAPSLCYHYITKNIFVFILLNILNFFTINLLLILCFYLIDEEVDKKATKSASVAIFIAATIGNIVMLAIPPFEP